MKIKKPREINIELEDQLQDKFCIQLKQRLRSSINAQFYWECYDQLEWRLDSKLNDHLLNQLYWQLTEDLSEKT